ncbi:MAG: hypothetical protein JO303_13500, partial [Caulobacteraceae bacterium]|nr:hypothetical protein [Caulobacteraceae bacterium]
MPAAEIDNLGHMNTNFYVQRAREAGGLLLDGLGAGAAARREAGLIVEAVDCHNHFRREQMQGALLRLSGGVVAAAGARFELYLEMDNVRAQETAAMFRLTMELQHKVTRRPAEASAPWLRAAQQALVEPPGRSRPQTLTFERLGVGLTPDDFARAGVRPHLRREIPAAECDADGFLAPEPRLRTVPDSFPSQGVMDQIWHRFEGFAWPLLELRTHDLRRPRAGDVLETYAALLSVGHKVIHWGSWVFEARTGALVSIYQQANILFNLATRRPQDMSAEVRAEMTALSSPGLPVAHQAPG